MKICNRCNRVFEDTSTHCFDCEYPLDGLDKSTRIAELEEKLKTVCEWAVKMQPAGDDECNSCADAFTDIAENPCDICSGCPKTAHVRHPALVIADEVTG